MIWWRTLWIFQNVHVHEYTPRLSRHPKIMPKSYSGNLMVGDLETTKACVLMLQHCGSVHLPEKCATIPMTTQTVVVVTQGNYSQQMIISAWWTIIVLSDASSRRSSMANTFSPSPATLGPTVRSVRMVHLRFALKLCILWRNPRNMAGAVAIGTTCLRSKLQRAAATMALAWIAWILTGELAVLGSPIQWSITLMRSTGASGIARSQQLSEVDSLATSCHPWGIYEVYMDKLKLLMESLRLSM